MLTRVKFLPTDSQETVEIAGFVAKQYLSFHFYSILYFVFCFFYYFHGDERSKSDFDDCKIHLRTKCSAAGGQVELTLSPNARHQVLRGREGGEGRESIQNSKEAMY